MAKNSDLRWAQLKNVGLSLICANPSAASHIPSPEKAAPCKDKVIRLSATNMVRHHGAQQHGRQSSPQGGTQRGPAPPPSTPAAAELPYLCGYKGCTFRARTKFEMQGHRYSKDCKGHAKALVL